MNYLDMSYLDKLEFWKKCAEEERLKIKLEECAKYIQKHISYYIIDDKAISASLEDCYDYVLQNGGYFKYSLQENQIFLELCKEDILPYYDPSDSKTKYMYFKGGNVDNVIACWSDTLSLVESFYCNDAMLSYGHDVRVPFNQGQKLFSEIYSELINVFPSMQFDTSKS